MMAIEPRLDHVTPPADAVLIKLAEAQDMLRAVAAGEVDAFVVSDGGEPGVFTLSTADHPYRMFVENVRDGAATLSADGTILYANRRLAELLACSREGLPGAALAEHVASASQAGLEQIRAAHRPGTELELELVDGLGVAVPVRVASWPLDVNGEALTCLTFTDLSALKARDREIARLSIVQAERMADLQEAQAALRLQATHDALTGLPNRTLLIDRIDQALAQTKRSRRCVAVLFVDLDRFKQVNDTDGHAAGDGLLRSIADRLTAVMRPMDTVARIGGDEFVVLAPDVDSELHAVDISARLVTEMSRGPRRDEDFGRIAASVGVTVSVAGRGTAEELLNEADTAMYKAKSLGGGRAMLFDAALGHHVHERAIAQRLLQSALDERRVVAHYQPIIDLVHGRVAGFEALARITEHDGSITSPAAFIPVAEDTGLIVPLGEHVLELACREAGGWPPSTYAAAQPTIAVNISARQLAVGDLTAVVRDTLASTGLDPRRLHLELTETAVIDLDPSVLTQLGGLKELGVQIGLDDFGTGYASLTHLRRLPLTFVKIDQSFVQGIGATGGDDRIVSAVVDLARNLGLRSIAEGVETDAQLHRLRKLGCDQAQGYLFNRPLPARQLPEAIGACAW
jgi:diguanylate cyclase (GGDEF)-like protein/PAS domain S-box-containing protein